MLPRMSTQARPSMMGGSPCSNGRDRGAGVTPTTEQSSRVRRQFPHDLHVICKLRPALEPNIECNTQDVRARHFKRKATTMTKFLVTSVTAGALAPAALGLAATAGAVPLGGSNADSVVSELQSQGYRVFINGSQ